jgi:hypothetical protein
LSVKVSDPEAPAVNIGGAEVLLISVDWLGTVGATEGTQSPALTLIEVA